MDPGRFLNALGDFSSNIAGSSIKALSVLWHREAGKAVGTVVPRCCHSANWDQRAPWFTKKLLMMKQFGVLSSRLKDVEGRWRLNTIQHLLAPIIRAMQWKWQWGGKCILPPPLHQCSGEQQFSFELLRTFSFTSNPSWNGGNVIDHLLQWCCQLLHWQNPSH